MQNVNVQNAKFDEYESNRMSTMAEMKFVQNKLQSFDINAKPAVTHTEVEQLQKVNFLHKTRRRRKRNNSRFFFQDVDNTRCEYEILKQQISHWMPCDEPVRIKLNSSRNLLSKHTSSSSSSSFSRQSTV